MIQKKTKIVCTIGPATWDPDVMRKLIENGMNCARVNGAFADPDELDKVRMLVKNVSNEVSLMVDVKGPEVRLNKFAEPLKIKAGDLIEIGNNKDSLIYPSNYSNLYKNLAPGQRMVIGDGDVELLLSEIKGEVMICEVVYGEIFKPGKALNLPGADYSSEVLTEKDIINLKHAINTGWDFVSASFIQSAEAAREVMKHLEGSHMKLIAKIEDQKGVDNIDEILEVVEGIMIARGGLGVELGLKKVPMVQHYLTMKANQAGKPVITATQMLESMTSNPSPTRAEVNDVATAVMLGSDAVMLSGESSAGEYPAESVRELSEIAAEVEEDLDPEIINTQAMTSVTTDAITKAAARVCIDDKTIGKVIIVSRTGNTARFLSRHNIRQPIYIFTKLEEYNRRMMLSRGIVRALVQEGDDFDRDEAVKHIIEKSKENGIIQKGDKILLLCKSTHRDSSWKFPNIFEIINVE